MELTNVVGSLSEVGRWGRGRDHREQTPLAILASLDKVELPHVRDPNLVQSVILARYGEHA